LRSKSLSVRVMAELIRREVRIAYSSTRRPMNRAQALALEKRMIARLVRAGYLLTNHQHNPHRHDHVDAAVAANVAPTPGSARGSRRRIQVRPRANSRRIG
jgi:hypothetical protein